MSISGVMSASILQTGLFDTASAEPVAFLYTPAAGTSASSTTPGASFVEISALGNLLSVASTIGGGMLQRAATSPGGVSTIIAATQLFVDAFNRFVQSSLGSLQNASGGSIGSQLVKDLYSQANAAPDDVRSLITRLASVGINLHDLSDLNDAGQLTIDAKALKSAFNTDPAGTSALLTQVFQSIGQLAAKYSGLIIRLETLTQIGASQGLLTTTASNDTPVSASSAATSSPAIPATISSSTAITPPSVTGQATTETQPDGAAMFPSTGQTSSTALSITTVQPAMTGSPTTTTQTAASSLATATSPETISPSATAGSPTAAESLTTTAQPTMPGLPTTTAQVSAATRSASEAATPTALIPPTTATVPLTDAGLPAQRVLPTEDVLPIPAAQAASATSLATTPAAITTALPVEPRFPITTVPPTTPSSTPAVATMPAVKAATIAPAPSNYVKALMVANDPATAAAIAAYHLVDGIFDTGRNPAERFSPGAASYSEIWPVAGISPSRLDIHA